MESVKIIKDSLRIIESKYVSGNKIDENSYDITFTYKNRNYELAINKQYKFIMLNIKESIYGMDIVDSTLDLINYIKQMITFTEYENYNVFTFSLRKENVNKKIHNKLQIINQTDDYDMIIDVESLDKDIPEYQSKIIEYNYGLDKFDKRLFDKDIFEDFNENVRVLCDEDLYLIYVTLISYLYKLINNEWKDEKIDPYIIDDMLNVIYNEIQNRFDEAKYYNWFNEWNKYFNEENIESYLNNRKKEKNKELK